MKKIFLCSCFLYGIEAVPCVAMESIGDIEFEKLPRICDIIVEKNEDISPLIEPTLPELPSISQILLEARCKPCAVLLRRLSPGEIERLAGSRPSGGPASPRESGLLVSSCRLEEKLAQKRRLFEKYKLSRQRRKKPRSRLDLDPEDDFESGKEKRKKKKKKKGRYEEDVEWCPDDTGGIGYRSKVNRATKMLRANARRKIIESASSDSEEEDERLLELYAEQFGGAGDTPPATEAPVKAATEGAEFRDILSSIMREMDDMNAGARGRGAPGRGRRPGGPPDGKRPRGRRKVSVLGGKFVRTRPNPDAVSGVMQDIVNLVCSGEDVRPEEEPAPPPEAPRRVVCRVCDTPFSPSPGMKLGSGPDERLCIICKDLKCREKIVRQHRLSKKVVKSPKMKNKVQNRLLKIVPKRDMQRLLYADKSDKSSVEKGYNHCKSIAVPKRDNQSAADTQSPSVNSAKSKVTKLKRIATGGKKLRPTIANRLVTGGNATKENTVKSSDDTPCTPMHTLKSSDVVISESKSKEVSPQNRVSLTDVGRGLFLMTFPEPDKELDMDSKSKKEVPKREVQLAPKVTESKPPTTTGTDAKFGNYVMSPVPTVVVANYSADAKKGDYYLSSVYYQNDSTTSVRPGLVQKPVQSNNRPRLPQALTVGNRSRMPNSLIVSNRPRLPRAMTVSDQLRMSRAMTISDQLRLSRTPTVNNLPRLTPALTVSNQNRLSLTVSNPQALTVSSQNQLSQALSVSSQNRLPQTLASRNPSLHSNLVANTGFVSTPTVLLGQPSVAVAPSASHLIITPSTVAGFTNALSTALTTALTSTIHIQNSVPPAPLASTHLELPRYRTSSNIRNCDNEMQIRITSVESERALPDCRTDTYQDTYLSAETGEFLPKAGELLPESRTHPPSKESATQGGNAETVVSVASKTQTDAKCSEKNPNAQTKMAPENAQNKASPFNAVYEEIEAIGVLAVIDLEKNPGLMLNMRLERARGELHKARSEGGGGAPVAILEFQHRILEIAQRLMRQYGSFSRVSDHFLGKDDLVKVKQEVMDEEEEEEEPTPTQENQRPAGCVLPSSGGALPSFAASFSAGPLERLQTQIASMEHHQAEPPSSVLHHYPAAPLTPRDLDARRTPSRGSSGGPRTPARPESAALQVEEPPPPPPLAQVKQEKFESATSPPAPCAYAARTPEASQTQVPQSPLSAMASMPSLVNGAGPQVQQYRGAPPNRTAPFDTSQNLARALLAMNPPTSNANVLSVQQVYLPRAAPSSNNNFAVLSNAANQQVYGTVGSNQQQVYGVSQHQQVYGQQQVYHHQQQVQAYNVSQQQVYYGQQQQQAPSVSQASYVVQNKVSHPHFMSFRDVYYGSNHPFAYP